MRCVSHNLYLTCIVRTRLGATGCGKTTQCPQLVLDDMIINGCGAEASMIVTQPRRISAIGVSERIASERCERVGESVGYSIRLENKRSSKTRLLLCTTGILLRRLQCDPDLASVSHVFVDEVRLSVSCHCLRLTNVWLTDKTDLSDLIIGTRARLEYRLSLNCTERSPGSTKVLEARSDECHVEC